MNDKARRVLELDEALPRIVVCTVCHEDPELDTHYLAEWSDTAEPHRPLTGEEMTMVSTQLGLAPELAREVERLKPYEAAMQGASIAVADAEREVGVLRERCDRLETLARSFANSAIVPDACHGNGEQCVLCDEDDSADDGIHHGGGCPMDEFKAMQLGLS